MNKNISIIIFFVILISSACNPKNSFDVDISGIEKIDLKIKRYEEVLFKINKDSIRNELNNLKSDYSFFIGDVIDTFDIVNLYNFLTDPTIVKANADLKEKYPHLKDIENDISLAFRYLKYYLPDFNIPEVYTYISGFDFEHPIKYADNTLVIGLDMYMGADYYFYPMIGIPDYKTYRMRRESIVTDCMSELSRAMLPALKGQLSFLDRMLYEGKRLYFLDITLPFVNDSVKIGFKPNQLEWCKRNESNMWRFFLEQNFLYSTDRKIIARFMDDGPFTPSFAADSPARTGAYIGWQIIRHFMKNNDTRIEDLFSLTDSQNILNKSKYKPKNK